MLIALTLPPLWAVTPDSAICYYSDKLEFEREIISTFVPQTYHKVMKNLHAGYLKPIHGSGFSASFTETPLYAMTVLETL